MATVVGFDTASLLGILCGLIHSVLPFVLLGTSIDDTFVITFDREHMDVRA